MGWKLVLQNWVLEYYHDNNIKRNEPWWDNECNRLKQEKYIQLREFRQINTPESLNKYKDTKNRFKHIWKQKKEEFQAKNKQELVSLRSDSNLFWKTVKKFRHKKSQDYDISCD